MGQGPAEDLHKMVRLSPLLGCAIALLTTPLQAEQQAQDPGSRDRGPHHRPL
jgi:hypothetical protein